MTTLDASTQSRRAQVIGLGLMGGSVAKALRTLGWHVSGSDHDQTRGELGLKLGIIDHAGVDTTAELCVICTPVSTVAEIAHWWCTHTQAVVTDVGSVKARISAEVQHRRFVGGHPMAGSELHGLEGSDAEMFHGAVWVLTPSAATSGESLALVHTVVAQLGAEVITIDPVEHDRIVAMISHVPHLTAGALMSLAAHRAEDHSALLRMAAGGFRDMTRIAAGDSAIWPDICAENSSAIVDVLVSLIDELETLRALVATQSRSAIQARLEVAREARLNLPSSVPAPEALAEVRIPVPDRPGVLAEITLLATQQAVNIYDIEIAHSSEGTSGVVIVVVDAAKVNRLRVNLTEAGYASSARELS